MMDSTVLAMAALGGAISICITSLKVVVANTAIVTFASIFASNFANENEP
jgi:hypothetical protein